MLLVSDYVNHLCVSLLYYIVARPSIIMHPLSITIRAGAKNEMIMNCEATGIGSINYNWEKYHVSSKSWIRPSHRATNIASPKLVYRVVKEEDEGIYHCVVSNGYDSAVSDSATLTVYGKYLILRNGHKT